MPPIDPFSVVLPSDREMPPDVPASEFAKGLRSGGLGMMGQLNSFGGAAGAAAGFPEFAKGRYAAAKEYNADAAAAAPRVTSLRDVHNAGDFGDWLAGTAGGAVPAMGLGVGAGLMTGGGAVPAMLAGTAAMAPFEVGDVVQRQQALGQEPSLRGAAVPGLISAAGQNIIPGLARAKLAGKMAAGSVAGNLAAIPEQAVLGGGAEAVKQAGVGQPLDSHAIMDAAAGNAVVGAPFAAMGAMGASRQKVGRGVDAVKDAVSKAPQAVADAVGSAAKTSADGLEGITKMAKDRSSAAVDQVINGSPIVDKDTLRSWAKMGGDQFNAAVKYADENTIPQVKKWGEDLADWAGLDEQKRATLSEAMGNLQSEGARSVVAGMKKAKDATANLGDIIDKFHTRMRKGEDNKPGDVVDVEARTAPDAVPEDRRIGVKKSEDYSGVRAKIEPILREAIGEVHPDALASDAMITKAGDTISKYLEDVASRNAAKKMTSNDVAHFIDLFGEKAGPVMTRIIEAVHGSDRAKAEKMFGAINQIRDIQKKGSSVADVLTKNLKPEHQDTYTTRDMREIANHLESWMRTPDDSERGRAHSQKINDMLESHFDKPEAVREAVRRKVKEEQALIDDPASHDLSEVAPDRVLYSKKPVLSHQNHVRDFGNEHSQAAREIADAEAKNPGTKARWVDAETWHRSQDEEVPHGLEGKGYVITESVPATDKLDAKSFNRLKFDSHLGDRNKNKSVLEAGDGIKLDAMKLGRQRSGAELPWSEGDDVHNLHRLARQFHANVAAVQDHLGHSFEIPDQTVVARRGSKDITAGMLKSVQVKEPGPGEKLQKLRDDFVEAKNSRDFKGMKAIRKEAAKLQEQIDRSLANEPEGKETPIDREVRERGGRQDPDKSNEDIVSAASRISPKELVHTTNLDGTPVSHVPRSSPATIEERNAALAQNKSEAPAKELPPAAEPKIKKAVSEDARPTIKIDGPAPATMVQRARDREAFLAAVRKSPEAVVRSIERAKDLESLQRAEENMKAFGGKETAATRTVSDAIEKRVEELGGPPSPKALAAKKAAFLEKARSGDAGLIESVGKETDPKKLQRAAEAMGPDTHPSVVEAINKRLGELVHDTDVAYGMQLDKKYSLESTRIHDDLGRMGFAATHDSPIRHEGKFNWRENHGKGEGAAAFGAGTYLSTADTVHKYYKGKFSADGGKSPTYHVSVDITPERMLNWDKKIEDQGATVRLRALKAMKDHGIEQGTIPDDTYVMKGGLKGAMTGGELYTALTDKLGSQAKASDYLQSLGILGHEYAAAAGKDKTAPNYVIYDDSKINTNYVHFDATKVNPNNAGPQNRSAVGQYIDHVLGNSVRLEFANIFHAGEFEAANRTNPQDTIRVSVHSLNPLSVGYHEALHAWFKQLHTKGLDAVTKPLMQAADTAFMRKQLETFLAGKPEALAQLHDAEERVAYMYQMYAADPKTFRAGPETKTLLGKVAEFFRKALGIMSNDERALHIMEYFHSGEYAKEMSRPSAIMEHTVNAGKNAALEKAKAMAEPLINLGETIGVAGAQRLRDTGIPALRELATLVKATGRDADQDGGFIPTARIERTQRMNRMVEGLARYDAATIKEALEASQRGVDAASTDGKIVQRVFSHTLAELKTYMEDAGVKVGDLGPKYFPRIWDGNAISKDQAGFLRMLEKYHVSGELKTDPAELMHKLIAADGNEFNTETPMPGMQFLKERLLSFISHDDAAPFQEKDAYRIMNSYVTQATRRAEWARRFGNDGHKLDALLDHAKHQGATDKQITDAQTYLKGVDGTLGDNLNPTARRLFGDMIVYQNIRLLPLGIFSSIVDPMGIMVRGGTVGDAFSAFKRGIKETVKNFQANPGRDAQTELSEALGVIDNAHLIHTLGASYSQGMVGDLGRTLNDKFFRYNLMEQFNVSMRVAATQAAMKFITKHADGTYSPHSKRFMEELGLSRADVHTDVVGDLKTFEHQGLTAEQAAKIKTAINRWVDGAVLRPDAADKPVWMNDPHFALLAHLKQFVYSFHETILKRVAHEYQHGNYTPAMALASYVPVMLAADAAKGLIQGGGSQPAYKQDWEASDYLWSATQRAGLFGSGQFAIDVLGDINRGGSGIGALSGPTLEQFADGVKVLEGREQFKHFVLHSMPANALYANAVGGPGASKADPMFAD